MKKKKLLFVYLRTGGGHLAPARAVAEHIDKYKSDTAETLLIDGLGKSRWLARFILEDGYRHLQSKATWFFEFLYLTHKSKFISYISVFLVSMNVTKYLRKVFREYQPDKIILFHFFLIEPTFSILRKLNKDIPVITVVTDPFTPPLLWFLNKKQIFILFSQKLKNLCIQKGIEESRLNVFPFILGEKYSEKPDDEKIALLKRKYGVENSNILLILGGGDGIPKGYKILKEFSKERSLFKIILVCGKNKKLYIQANRIKEKFGWDNLIVYGYVDFVYDLIGISDLVITKCGASTFMEILISGKIPIVNTYIWEQEKGNVDFIIENKLGIFEKRIDKLPGIVSNLFNDKKAYNEFKKNIDKIGLRNGSADAAEFICK
jgi:processive 1,2-diacylglycerol beta-glucosyltransferase/1,2-diacylglycerol 3-beta-galactosyltransferase